MSNHHVNSAFSLPNNNKISSFQSQSSYLQLTPPIPQSQNSNMGQVNGTLTQEGMFSFPQVCYTGGIISPMERCLSYTGSGLMGNFVYVSPSSLYQNSCFKLAQFQNKNVPIGPMNQNICQSIPLSCRKLPPPSIMLQESIPMTKPENYCQSKDSNFNKDKTVLHKQLHTNPINEEYLAESLQFQNSETDKSQTPSPNFISNHAPHPNHRISIPLVNHIVPKRSKQTYSKWQATTQKNTQLPFLISGPSHASFSNKNEHTSPQLKTKRKCQVKSQKSDQIVEESVPKVSRKPISLNIDNIEDHYHLQKNSENGSSSSNSKKQSHNSEKMQLVHTGCVNILPESLKILADKTVNSKIAIPKSVLMCPHVTFSRKNNKYSKKEMASFRKRMERIFKDHPIHDFCCYQGVEYRKALLMELYQHCTNSDLVKELMNDLQDYSIEQVVKAFQNINNLHRSEKKFSSNIVEMILGYHRTTSDSGKVYVNPRESPYIYFLLKAANSLKEKLIINQNYMFQKNMQVIDELSTIISNAEHLITSMKIPKKNQEVFPLQGGRFFYSIDELVKEQAIIEIKKGNKVKYE